MKVFETICWIFFGVIFVMAAYGELGAEYMIRKKQKEDMLKAQEELEKKQKRTSKDEMQDFLNELEEMKKGKIPNPPEDRR